MIGPFGQVLVMDWGTAKVASPAEPDDRGAEAGGAKAPPPLETSTTPLPRATATGTVIGTPGFMAPEQERRDAAHADARADVYALGALLAWLLDPATGSPRDAPRAVVAIRDRAMQRTPTRGTRRRRPSARNWRVISTACPSRRIRKELSIPVRSHVRKRAFDGS
jgi:serine/threonine protein kinase